MRVAAIEQFPGLDLRRDPGEAVGALDAMNVTLEPGWVRTRDGCSLLYSPVGTPVFLASQGYSKIVIVCQGSPGNVYLVDGTGTLVASTTLASVFNSGASAVSIGAPAAGELFYVVADGLAVQRYAGAWTAPVGFPANTRLLAYLPTSNRLVAVDNDSKVSFSDPGAPETFTATNFEQLTPGDGELVTAVAVYNNQLFVFKKSKFFVFYGESVDGSGEPIFNYRTVSTGVGVAFDGPVAQAAIGTPTGVYFFGQGGIYRTTGGAPEKISGAVDPVFNWAPGTTIPYWQGGVMEWGGVRHRLHWQDGCLYAAIETLSSTGMTLVWDSRQDSWTCWGMRSNGFTRARNFGASLPALIWASPTGGVLRQTGGLTSDNGAAIVSRYRTGFQSFGDPGDKKLTEAILEGSGTPTLQWSDDRGALEAGAAVTLGVSPAFATGRRRFARRGRSFSAQLGASSGAWKVHRMQVNLTNRSRTPRVAT